MTVRISHQRPGWSMAKWGLPIVGLTAAVWAGQATLDRPLLPVPLVGAAAEQSDSSRPPAETETVRLNFVAADWPTVLKMVAEETGSTLVMDRVPQGRFNRLDRHRYSRIEAVRILNRELELLGFRLLEQGTYLVLVDLSATRTRYRQPAMTPPPEQPLPQPNTAHNPPQFPIPQRSVSTITSRDRKDVGGDWRPLDGDEIAKAGDRRQEAGTGPSGVRQASHDDGSGKPAAPPKAVPEEQVVESVTVRQRPATDVARQIYTAFKARAELIDDGPDGLPAFQVYRAHPAKPERDGRRPVDFTVGLDVEQQRLVIAAPASRARGVAELVRRLDAAPTDPARTTEVVPSQADVKKMAAGLRPVLARLASQRERQDEPVRQPPQERRILPAPLDEEPPLPPDRRLPDAPPLQEVPPIDPAGPPALQLHLRGPVTVQDVPGVGLVVTGAREDVEAVIRMIRELEAVALVAIPDIHLLFLRHVESVAMAELLNSVYEQLAGLRGPDGLRMFIQVIPVGKPNAILILAPEGEMEGVVQLAEELDQPVDPRGEFQVFFLRHAIAAQVVTLIEDFYRERIGLGTRVLAIPDARTNAVIVQARSRDLQEVARLIRQVDRDEAGPVTKMRIFPLTNGIAPEMADLLNAAIQSVLNPPGAIAAPGQAGVVAPPIGVGVGIGPTTERLQEVKSAVIELFAADGNPAGLLRSGILADIRVTADVRMNSLIVTASERSLPMMAELIRQLDQPTPTVADIKVFTLVNSDAQAITQLLRTLFEPVAAPQALPGVIVAGAEDAASGLIPLRFSVDLRTNSVLAIGGAEALRVVEAIILRLDETDIRQRQNTVIRLQNSPALRVAEAINQFLTAQRELMLIDPDLVSPVELLEREIIVVPEEISNSLLISATPRFFGEIMRVVAQLDLAPAQVIIQALLVEVELRNTDEFGVELGFQDSILFDRSLISSLQTVSETVTGVGGELITQQRILSAEGDPGFRFNNAPLGNNVGAPNPGRVGTQGLSHFSLGRVNADLGFGGLVLSAGSESVSVLIRALAAKRKVHVLSRPQIRTLDNQLAMIQVGQQVPIVTGVAVTGIGAAMPTIQQANVGIILEVTPRIAADGTVVMETIATRSALSPIGVPIFTDVTTGQVVESPIIDISTARASVAIPNGQTVVLGGMITKSDDSIERRVPFIGDIPILGLPFRYDALTTRRTELLIFLTPRIIRCDEDSELIKRVEAERIHFIERDAEEIHGPLYSVPPTPGWGPNPLLPPGLPGAFPHGPFPHGAFPDGAFPHGAFPDGAFPDGAFPDGAFPHEPFPGGPALDGEAPWMEGPPPAEDGSPTFPPLRPPAFPQFEFEFEDLHSVPTTQVPRGGLGVVETGGKEASGVVPSVGRGQAAPDAKNRDQKRSLFPWSRSK